MSLNAFGSRPISLCFWATGFEAFRRAIKKVLKRTKAWQRVDAGLWGVFFRGKETTNKTFSDVF